MNLTKTIMDDFFLTFREVALVYIALALTDFVG